MRGPDLSALQAEVDAVARSLTFNEAPSPLDAADQRSAIAAAIDSVDRSMRAYPGRRFLACMPRAEGSVTTTIQDGPRGRLLRPLEVTCTTTVQANDLRVWEATLEVEWAATADQDAGRWARQVLFDGGGVVQETDLSPGTGAGMWFPGDPSRPRVTERVGLFRAGDLVRSVGEGAGTAFYDVDASKLPPEPHLFLEPGSLAVILSGPEAYDDRDFYLADNGLEIGWVGSEARGRPVLLSAEPNCPKAIDATELAYLPSLERRRCVTGDVMLGPVQASQIELDPSLGLVESDPSWLAAEPSWAIYGVAGLQGLDRGLPVALAPGLESLPTNRWLEITGHFDDPASGSCTVRYPPDWGPAPGPDATTRRCKERFVVTSAATREGP